MLVFLFSGILPFDTIPNSSKNFKRFERIFVAIFSLALEKSLKVFFSINAKSRIINKDHLSPTISKAELTGQSERNLIFFFLFTCILKVICIFLLAKQK